MGNKKKTAVLFALLLFFAISSSAQEPQYFMILADPQLGFYLNDKAFTQESANFEFAVATVNRLKPAFTIILGDFANKTGDAKQTREFFRISGKIDSSVPVYYIAGNHDVGHTPTPEMLSAYRKKFGRDYYSFRAGLIYGIVLNSSLIYEPKNVAAEYENQLSWLRNELERAKASGAPHIVIFQHHPYFLSEAKEPDQYFTIPNERRKLFLDLFRKYGVHHVFAGHTHKNYVARDGDLEMVTSGPVGMPFDEDRSGIRLAAVTPSGIEHRYFDFGKLPAKLTITPSTAVALPAKKE
jgi:serine/threonine-protein phosphatase CPPED1